MTTLRNVTKQNFFDVGISGASVTWRNRIFWRNTVMRGHMEPRRNVTCSSVTYTTVYKTCATHLLSVDPLIQATRYPSDAFPRHSGNPSISRVFWKSADSSNGAGRGLRHLEWISAQGQCWAISGESDVAMWYCMCNDIDILFVICKWMHLAVLIAESTAVRESCVC